MYKYCLYVILGPRIIYSKVRSRSGQKQGLKGKNAWLTSGQIGHIRLGGQVKVRTNAGVSRQLGTFLLAMYQCWRSGWFSRSSIAERIKLRPTTDRGEYKNETYLLAILCIF